MIINNPNCERFYLPDGDELVGYGGPLRDQIVARITFDNATNTEIQGREDIPLKKDGHDELVGPIPNGPKDITTSLYWHNAPRGVPRPLPQSKTYEKETNNARRYQVPSKKDGDPFTWAQVFRRQTFDMGAEGQLVADHDYLDPSKDCLLYTSPSPRDS